RQLRCCFESLLFARRRVSVRRARLLFRRSNRCERNTFPERKLSDSGLAHIKCSQLFRLESVQPQRLRIQRGQHWRRSSADAEILTPMNNRPASSAPRAERCGRGLLICLLLTAACLSAAQLQETRVTQVVKDVKLGPPQAAQRGAAVGESVRDGDAISTGAAGRSELTFADQTIARLGAKTIVSFSDGMRTMDLVEGAVLIAKGTYIPSNPVIFGRGTLVNLVNPTPAPLQKPQTNTGHYFTHPNFN